MCHKVDRGQPSNATDSSALSAQEGAGRCKKKKKCGKEDTAQLQQQLQGLQQQVAELKQMLQGHMSQCRSPQDVNDSRNALSSAMGGQMPPQFQQLLAAMANQRMGQLGFPANTQGPGSVNIYNWSNTNVNVFNRFGAPSPLPGAGNTIATLPAPSAPARQVPTAMQSPFRFA